MTAAPKFSPIVTSFSEEDIKASEKKVSKFFNPGTYDVVIQEISFKRVMEKDTDWGVYEMVLGNGQKTVKNWVLVPFKDIVYKAPGVKNQFTLYFKLRDFFAAIGEELHKGNLKLISDYFSGNNSQKLVGKSLNIEIGYKGDHIGYNSETKRYFVAREDGKPRIFNGQSTEFPSREEAVALAAEQRIVIADFPEILRLNPRAASEDNNDTDTAADSSWDD